MKQLCSSLPIHSEYIKIQQKFTISSSYLQLAPVLSRWTLISLYHDRFRNVYKFSQEPWELKLSIYGLSPKTRSMLNPLTKASSCCRSKSILLLKNYKFWKTVVLIVLS